MAADLSPSITAVCNAFIQRIPGVEHVLLSNAYGLPIFRVSAESATTDPEALESQFAIVFAKSCEAADKLQLGKTKNCVAFYNEFTLVQVSIVPLVLAVVASPEANVGMVLHLLPQLQKMLEPVRAAAEEATPS